VVDDNEAADVFLFDPDTGLAKLHFTFVITNTGLAPLILEDPLISGSGYAVQPLEARSVPPDGSSMFDVEFSSSSLGTYGGQVTFRTNDFGGLDFAFDLLVEVVDDDTPPSVELVAPPDGRSLIEGTTIPIGAEAVDDVGVKRVNLIIDGQTVESDDAFPYQFEFKLPTGTDDVVIGAEVEDVAGNKAQTPPVTIQLLPDQPPTVHIVRPPDGDGVLSGTLPLIQIDAFDDVGVTRVELRVDGQLVEELTDEPFVTRFPLPDLPGGMDFDVVACATDTAQHQQCSQIVLTVTPGPIALPPGGGTFELRPENGDLVLRRADGTEVSRVQQGGRYPVHIVGSDGADDLLKVKLDGITDEIHFDGGAGGNDALQLDAATVRRLVKYSFTSQSDGEIRVQDVSLNFQHVVFRGLEPIADNLSTEFREFSVETSGDIHIRLLDDGDVSNGMTTIDADGTAAFETVTFVNPTGSLTIQDATGGASHFRLESPDPGFSAALIVDGGAADDTLQLAGDGNALDLRAATGSGIIGVESIESVDTQSQSLTLDVAAVENSGADPLTVQLDDQDAIGLGDGWALQTPQFVGGLFFNVLTGGQATLHLRGPHLWQNPLLSVDVTGESDVFALDALILINAINGRIVNPLPEPAEGNAPPDYLDPSGDGNLFALDVLQVVNFINAAAAGVQPEPEAVSGFPVAIDAATSSVAPAEQPQTREMPAAAVPSTGGTHSLRVTVPTPGSGSFFGGNTQPLAQTLTPKSVPAPLNSSRERLPLRLLLEAHTQAAPNRAHREWLGGRTIGKEPSFSDEFENDLGLDDQVLDTVAADVWSRWHGA